MRVPVQVAGEVRDLLAGHHRLVAARGELDRLPAGVELVHVENTGRHSRAIVRTTARPPRLPWAVEPVTLEELVLGYLTRAAGGEVSR